MEIDPATLLCSLTVDKFANMFEGDSCIGEKPSVNIYLDTALQPLFPALPYQFSSATIKYSLRI